MALAKVLSGFGGAWRAAASWFPAVLGSGLLALAPSARANSVDAVTVTINAINYNGHEFDSIFEFGGQKPDFFATVRFLLDDGSSVRCGSSTPVFNIQFSSPNQVICTGTRVRRPYVVEVEVWDADDTLTPPLRAEQADMNPDPTLRAWRSLPFVSSANTTRVFAISGPDANATVTVAPTPLLSSFVPAGRITTSAASLDPTAAERVIITGVFDIPSSVSVFARPLAGGPDIPIAASTPPMAQFNFDWDGRDGAGQPLAPGSFQVIAVGPNGVPTGQLATPLQVVRRNAATLTLLGVTPAAGLPSANVEVRVAASRAGAISLAVFWNTCGAGPPIATMPSGAVVGANFLGWNGRDSGGSPAPAGTYCFRISGTANSGGGAFNTLQTNYQIIADSVVRLAIRPEPMAPALDTGRPVSLIATPLDNGNRATAAQTVRIFAAPYSGPGSSVPGQLIGTCTNSSRCAIPLPANLMAAGTISYFADATGAAGGQARTPVRLTDLAPPAGGGPGPVVVRTSVATQRLVGAGSVTETSHADAIDIVHYPGTGYDLTQAADRALFASVLADDFETMLGVSARWATRSSMVQTNLGEVSFFASTTPVQVDNTAGVSPNDFTNNLCVFSAGGLAPFADVNAVQHRMNCRDNAPGGAYSTKAAPTISWHEFHHAGFGLADEYATDGGYWQDAVTPNVYNDLNQCMQFSSNSTNCRRLGGNPGDKSFPFFRSDPDPDVMTVNTIENADDIRAAIRKFSDCRAGRC